MKHEDIIMLIYQAFNKRDIDTILKHVHSAVEWPTAWEGGYVFGHAAVRDYWIRQWAEIDPIVNPILIKKISADELSVSVQQLVKDKQGTVIANETVQHYYFFANGLIKRMVIAGTS